MLKQGYLIFSIPQIEGHSILAVIRRQPGQREFDRSVTLPAGLQARCGRHRAIARALVVRGAVAGRSGLLQRLVPRHIVQASSHSLRCVGTGLPLLPGLLRIPAVPDLRSLRRAASSSGPRVVNTAEK